MSSTTMSVVIGYLAEMFAFEGIPLEIFSDRGQPFNYKEWYTLVDKNHFKAHYLQSNSFIERHVCTMKSALNKAKAFCA